MSHKRGVLMIATGLFLVSCGFEVGWPEAHLLNTAGDSIALGAFFFLGYWAAS